MQSDVFPTVLKFRLRVPLFDAPFPCPTRSNEGKACNAEMDVFGDHAACCQHGPSLLFRHNNVRDILGHAARGSQSLASGIVQATNRLCARADDRALRALSLSLS